MDTQSSEGDKAGKGSSILFLTGMDLNSLRGAGFAHRMNNLLRYMDERGIPYTAIFPTARATQNSWRAGSGLYLGLPVPTGTPAPPESTEGDAEQRLSAAPIWPLQQRPGDYLQATARRFMRAIIRHARETRNHWRLCIVQGELVGSLAITLRKLGYIDFVAYEDLDYFPAFAGLSKSFGRRQAAMIEGLVVKNADLVISVSDELTQLRKEQGAKSAVTVPNGVDFSHFAPARESRSRKPLLLYSGSILEWCGVDKAILALPKILKGEPAAGLRIIGGGPFESHLKAVAGQHGVARAVEFLGPRLYDDLPRLVNDCSVGLAVFPKNELMHYAFPLKVIDYLAAGLPIVSTGADATKRILEETRSGVIVNDDPAVIADACLNLLHDKEAWAEMSERAKTAAKALDWNVLFDEEFARIEKAAGGLR